MRTGGVVLLDECVDRRLRRRQALKGFVGVE
jgi:hypothetical protein